jgi:hypothetical protein
MVKVKVKIKVRAMVGVTGEVYGEGKVFCVPWIINNYKSSFTFGSIAKVSRHAELTMITSSVMRTVNADTSHSVAS